MKICLYTETALPKMGGQEMVVDVLARELQHLGHQVTVLAPQPRLPLRARDHGLPYPVVRHPRFYSTRLFVPWYRWWLTRLYRSFPFDILHCHSVYPTGFLAGLLRDRLPAPCVITSHGGCVNEGSRRVRGLNHRHREAVARADALVAISRFTENGYLRLGATPASIRHIPNGVPLENYAPAAPRPAGLDPAIQPGQYVVFLGRLKPRKGVDLLLRALAQVPETGEVQAVIAGDGEERANLECLADSLGLAERVRFVGPVQGMTKTYLLQNATCLTVLSRTWEAFPLVVLEGLAAGTPVLGTRIPGLEDLIDPGRTGWLVAPESVEGAAEVLRQIFTAQVDRDRMRQTAVAAAQSFSWRRIAEKHVRLYEELLARPRERAA